MYNLQVVNCICNFLKCKKIMLKFFYFYFCTKKYIMLILPRRRVSMQWQYIITINVSYGRHFPTVMGTFLIQLMYSRKYQKFLHEILIWTISSLLIELLWKIPTNVDKIQGLLIHKMSVKINFRWYICGIYTYIHRNYVIRNMLCYI